MRRQSIFQSTKQIVQASASTIEETAKLTTDVVSYARAEMKATANISNLENNEEFVSTKMSILRGYYTELATLQAQPASDLTKYEIELIQSAIKEIQG